MKSKITTFILILVLYSCAPQQPPATPTLPPEATLIPSATPTPLPTFTPTPLSTYTPKPVITETTAVFDLEGGGTLEMPALFSDKLNSASAEVKTEIELMLLNRTMEIITSDNLNWGDLYASQINSPTLSKEGIELQNKFLAIDREKYQLQFRGGLTVPFNLDVQITDKFFLGTIGAQFNKTNGTILMYETKEEDGIGYGFVFVQVEINSVINNIRNNMITVPPNPQ